MPDDKIKISALTGALSLDNDDVMVIVQDENGDLITKKVSLSTLGSHICEDMEFSSQLQTTSKKIIGAINELNSGGGGGGSSTLAGLTDVSISSPTNDQVLKYNSTSQKWENGTGGAAWVELTGTLTAGQTSLTISDASITTSSTIDYYTDIFGVAPTDVVVTTGQVVLTFDAQASNMGVKVRIS